MTRVNYIGAPEFFELNTACRALTEAYGWCVYHVGSSIQKRDYRDVDVRCILGDDEFERLFPGERGNWTDARWSLLCMAISLWLSKRTGLPIDFQFQRQSEANKKFSSCRHPRNAVGVFVHRDVEADPPEVPTSE